MNEQSLQDVFKQAMANKWVYPQLFDALKEIGVERYDVNVLTHEMTYVGGATSMVRPAPAGFRPPLLGTFDAAAFKTALIRSQKQQTGFEQFLVESAAAGISFYTVDMKSRTVTYYGEDRRNQIVEPVPPSSK